MRYDRIIQIIALGGAVLAAVAAGNVLPSLVAKSDAHALRYTDVSVEGAPPIVALGTMIGAVRGLIVDYLWIKVHLARERGQYYEVMHDAEMITRLQPRFSAVWAFHGHNMAYNISVTTNTQQERWEWVNAGIRLVRNRGLRYNPNDLELHRELAFWFAHKVDGYSDDAHLYYKRQFCLEWHFVLGQPPESYEERIEWIKAIAEAPETLEEAERRTPGVRALVDRLSREMGQITRAENFHPDKRLLQAWGEWKAVTEQSMIAEMLGYADQWRATRPVFRAFDEIAADPDLADAWETLLLYARKRVLIDEYNMEPQLMYEFTRDLGPIDWRNAQSHALYFSRRGMLRGEPRFFHERDIYKVVNNDRIQLQAMQGLARWGRITFDPFSPPWEPPSRFPDRRWVETIDKMAERKYVKHYDTRGAGGETFLTFLQNYMSSAVRELYRSGEWAEAQQLLNRLDELFGIGQLGGPVGANYRYRLPLDVFVREEVLEEYAFQPHLAPSEVEAALRRGIRVGVGQNRQDVFEQSLQFAHQVTEYFKTNEYYDFETQFGTGRIKDIIGRLEQSLHVAFEQIMTDSQIPLQERLTIWRQVDQFHPELRLRTYDRIRPFIEQQFAMNPLSQRYAVGELFTQPPGIEQYRVILAQERQARLEREERERERGELERR